MYWASSLKGIVLTAKCQSVYFPPFSYNPDSLFPNQTCPSGSFDLSAHVPSETVSLVEIVVILVGG